MICAACGHDNRQGAKFCTECGAALARACTGCGTPVEPGEKFCAECGSVLASETSVRASLSPDTVSVSGEKKHITVLFADVAGSMDLQERLDAEVWAQIMGRFVSILAEGVRRFGGTVDKFTGDGIMALFGAPVAQEDHARRACHAAWHLTKSIGEYSEELRQSHGIDLQVRLGLNSGEVVVGRIGDDVTIDATALGHTVGLAQRMEAMADPGKAYLTVHTERLVEGWFRLDDLGARPVKGASEPLRVYVLDGPVTSPVRQTPGVTPFVGRERELAVLEDALTAAINGRAQVVGVVGEAGVGKSRLCDEFAHLAEARGAIVRRTTGVSHGKDLPLLPILSFLRSYFGITETDSAAEARKKIEDRLLALDPALEHSLPLLFDFLEVPDAERPAPRLASEVRMDRLFATFRRITARRSEREVLVLTAEDLHWFDPQSEVLLERLIESFPGSRTLVVANFRPEFSAPWMRHSYYCQLPVAPLPDPAVGELLRGLLGTDLSLAPLLSFVQEHTGGNPFFVEEVVRALVEDGTLIGERGGYRLSRPLHEVNVPPSVQAVLAARIDRLDDEDKCLLQAASVIGRDFPGSVLVVASGVGENKVVAMLARLAAAEFIHEVGSGPLQEYRFWHSLTREVAYRSLMRERRTVLHHSVAHALIAAYRDRLDEPAALIAYHFEQAGDRLHAAGWNDRAGDVAARSDVGEAMRRWKAALVHLESAPATDEALRLGVLARNRLMRYGARTGMDPDEAARLYADARTAAERLQDPRQLASVTFAFGSILLWRGRTREGLDLYVEAAYLAEQTDDRDAQAGHWAPATIVRSFTGSVTEGLQAAETVLNLCGGDPSVAVSVLGFSPMTLAVIAQAELLALSGQLQAAKAALDNALACAGDRAEAEWLVWALSGYSRLARDREEFDLALDRAQEGVRIAEDCGNTSSHVVALSAVGISEVGLRRFREAAGTVQHALDEARQRQVALFEEPRLLVHLALANIGMGCQEAAHQAADEAVGVARRQGAQVFECHALLTRHQIRRRTGATHDPADLVAASELVNQTGAAFYEPFIHEEIGRLRDDEDELRGALRLYRRMGETGHALRLEAELSGSISPL